MRYTFLQIWMEWLLDIKSLGIKVIGIYSLLPKGVNDSLAKAFLSGVSQK
jgi:hypothetical protein